jgi:hypothetical protein
MEHHHPIIYGWVLYYESVYHEDLADIQRESHVHDSAFEDLKKEFDYLLDGLVLINVRGVVGEDCVHEVTAVL